MNVPAELVGKISNAEDVKSVSGGSERGGGKFKMLTEQEELRCIRRTEKKIARSRRKGAEIFNLTTDNGLSLGGVGSEFEESRFSKAVEEERLMYWQMRIGYDEQARKREVTFGDVDFG